MAGTAKIARQADLDKGLKTPKKAIVDVTWLDACAHMRVKRLDPGRLTDLLVESHTMGRVVAQDKNVLCVATHMNDTDGVDLIAIPIKWIEKVEMFNG
ncbi:TPA: hypothetical protein HA265_06080 [Candidatus Woesearchaeota archaeon]|nr:hypothetical protein [Candidatus Woesearchaeota archaeon]